METLPPVNHIFIDFENVHEVDLSLIGQKFVDLTLLIGPKQTKLNTSLVEKILPHANSVHLIRLTEPGRNALDFALAYYVGRSAALDPSGYFHIISGDTGYDPLIAHLRRNQVRAHRHPNFESLKALFNPLAVTPPAPAILAPKAKPAPKTIPAPPKPAAAPLDERATHALEHLRDHPKNRPAREATLLRHMKNLFGQKITDTEAVSVVEMLRLAGHLAITEKGAVTYKG